MRGVEKAYLAAVLLFVSILASLQQARAFDLTGAWATSVDECKNVFVRKGKANRISFAPMSEVHGEDLAPSRTAWLDAPRTARSRRGRTMVNIASCATDIIVSPVQFQLNVVNQDKVRRLFPGMEDMEIFYYRCPI
jgi:hypothetical protein